jgi:hypothetical protein
MNKTQETLFYGISQLHLSTAISEQKTLTQVHPIVRHIDVEVTTKRPLQHIPHIPKLTVTLCCCIKVTLKG